MAYAFSKTRGWLVSQVHESCRCRYALKIVGCLLFVPLAGGYAFAQNKPSSPIVITDTVSSDHDVHIVQDGKEVHAHAVTQSVTTQSHIDDSIAASEDATAFASLAAEVTPFLTGYYYTSGKQSLLSFRLKAKVMSKRKSLEYMGVEGSKPPGWNLPRFPANVHLALFFRDWPMLKTDSSLEYRLVEITKNGGDTSIPWKKTGNYLTIPELKGNESYVLMVRYQNGGDNVSAYMFSTYSRWYPYWHKFQRYIPVLLLFSIPFAVFFLWKFLTAKRRSRQYQLELKALFSQLNPHFLFNSLSSIQGLMNNNEIEKANQYLSGFSGLLRTTLDKGGKETIPLSEELDNLENYIRFEQLRFNFQYQKDIEPQLPLEDIPIPPLLAQPLIENSVKHGLAGMGERGSLTLRIYSAKEDLFLSVKDNGKGFDVAAYEPGYGIDLVYKRIELYNKWHRKSKLYLTMKSEPGNTVMTLQLQKWLPK